MLQANKEVREKMRAGKIPVWKLADAIGISETTAQRMLRKEITGDKLLRVKKAIDVLTAEGSTDRNE